VIPPAKRVAAALALLLIVACGGSPPDTAPSPSPAPAPQPAPSPVPVPAPAPPQALVTLRGIVRDEKGAPMPDAFVAIARSPTSFGPVTYTDANGAFAIGGIEPGLKVVEARQWRYQTIDREVYIDGVTPVNFSMQLLPQVTFSGVVSDADSGAPVPGAVVRFLDSPGARDNAGLTAVSDSTGRYRFEKVYTANSNFSVSAGGYQEWRNGLHVFGDTVLDFQLRRVQPPQTFTGSVGGSTSTQDFPFTMRRVGSADVTLTWQPPAASAPRLQVQIVPLSGPLTPAPAAPVASANRLDVSFPYVWAGQYALRVVNPAGSAGAPTPFSMTFTQRD